jgi:hypothetical protein
MICQGSKEDNIGIDKTVNNTDTGLLIKEVKQEIDYTE